MLKFSALKSFLRSVLAKLIFAATAVSVVGGCSYVVYEFGIDAPSMILPEEEYRPTFHENSHDLALPIAVLLQKNSKRGFCSAVIVSSEYAFTAAHCFKKMQKLRVYASKYLEFLRPSVVVADNNFGNQTEAVLLAYIQAGDTDVALLRGDFRKYNQTIVDYNYSYDLKYEALIASKNLVREVNFIEVLSSNNSSSTLMTLCGYMHASTYKCVNSRLISYWGSNYIVLLEDDYVNFGMSGGAAVIYVRNLITGDVVPVVIGIIRAIDTYGHAYISSLVGIDKLLFNQ